MSRLQGFQPYFRQPRQGPDAIHRRSLLSLVRICASERAQAEHSTATSCAAMRDDGLGQTVKSMASIRLSSTAKASANPAGTLTPVPTAEPLWAVHAGAAAGHPGAARTQPTGTPHFQVPGRRSPASRPSGACDLS